MDSSKTDRLSDHLTNFSGEQGKEKVLLTLTGSAVIDTAIIAAAAFKKALGQSKPLIVNLTALTEVDASFIQLLLALGKSVKAIGFDVSLNLLNDDHALVKAARLSGIMPLAAGSWFNLTYPYSGRDLE